MSRFFSAELVRTLACMTAALLLSTTFVAAAIGPAHVGAPVEQVA